MIYLTGFAGAGRLGGRGRPLRQAMGWITRTAYDLNDRAIATSDPMLSDATGSESAPGALLDPSTQTRSIRARRIG